MSLFDDDEEIPQQQTEDIEVSQSNPEFLEDPEETDNEPILEADPVENDFTEYNPDDEIDDNEEDTSIEEEAETQNEPVSDVETPEPTKAATKGGKNQSQGTYAFRETMRKHLQQKAETDELFAPFFANPNKNIDDCATYIINWVKAQNKNGFTDAEIFGQAVHYYEEERINVGKEVPVRIVSNHTVELTPEEKEQAHQDAIINEQKEYISRLKVSTKPKPKAPVVEMGSLW